MPRGDNKRNKAKETEAKIKAAKERAKDKAERVKKTFGTEDKPVKNPKDIRVNAFGLTKSNKKIAEDERKKF